MNGPGSSHGQSEEHSALITEAINNALADNPHVTGVDQDGSEIVITWDDGSQSNIDVDSHDYIGY